LIGGLSQVDRLRSEQISEVTKYLAPEIAKDAPPLNSGENYNPVFDADYEPQVWVG
jgi:hypothetical protein